MNLRRITVCWHVFWWHWWWVSARVSWHGWWLPSTASLTVSVHCPILTPGSPLRIRSKSLSLTLSTSAPLPPSCSSVTPRHSSAEGPGTSSLDVTMGMVFLFLKKKNFNAWFDYYLIVKGSWSPQFLGSFSHGAPFCRMLSRSFCRNGGVLCKYDRGRGIVMGITHTAHKSFSLKNGRIFTKYSTFTICVEHSIFSTSSCNRFTVL